MNIKYIAVLAILATAPGAWLAAAESAIDSRDGELIEIASSGPEQADRRLSNQELRERIYALENRLANLELASSRLNRELDSGFAQRANEYLGLNKTIENLATSLSTERDLRASDEKRLNELAEALRQQISAERLERASGLEELESNLNVLISELTSELSQNKELATEILAVANSNQTELNTLSPRVDKTENDLADQADLLNSKFVDLDNLLSSRTILGGGLILLVTLIIIVIARKVSTSRQDLVDKLESSSQSSRNDIESFRKDHESVREDYVQLDMKLTELLERQLASVDAEPEKDQKPDHTLPLQVAAEIHRMKKRLENMPEGTKGVPPLVKALERLEESLGKKGYELQQLLGQPYIEGMTAKARFEIDEKLQAGEQIITRVIKPQVNYRGALIQVPDVEVSVGE